MTIEEHKIEWSKPVAINFKANGDIEFDATESCWDDYYGFFVISIDTIETDQLLCIGKSYDNKIRDCVIKKYREIHGPKILPKDKKYKAQAGIIVSNHNKPDSSEESKRFFHDIYSLLNFDNRKLLHLNAHKSTKNYDGRNLEITNENCGLIKEKSSSPSVIAYKLFKVFKVKKIRKGGLLEYPDIMDFFGKKLKEYDKEHINNAIDYLEENGFVEKIKNSKYGKNGFDLKLLVRRNKSFDDDEYI